VRALSFWENGKVSQDANKRLVAVAALSYLEDGIVLGVGTGSTADIFIAALPPYAARLSAVVSSSERSTSKLRALGIAVAPLADVNEIDLYVDGADEATKRLHLIKGGGGALTREKILAGASKRFVCIVDDAKMVSTLGKFPLPVEVIPMAEAFVARQMIKAGGQPQLRQDFVTDNGNHIYDCRFASGIADPRKLEDELRRRAGIVETGLFLGIASVALIADEARVEVRKR